MGLSRIAPDRYLREVIDSCISVVAFFYCFVFLIWDISVIGAALLGLTSVAFSLRIALRYMRTHRDADPKSTAR